MTKSRTLPLLPLRGLTIFPDMVLHFDVGREKSIAAVNEAMLQDEEIFLVAQKDMEVEDPTSSDILTIGVISKIKQIVKLPGDTLKVLVEGKVRGRITQFIENDNYYEVEIEELENTIDDNEELEGYFNSLKDAFLNYVKQAGEGEKELLENIENEEDVRAFINMVANFVPLNDEKRQELLETIDIREQIEFLIVFIEKEIKVIDVQKKLASKIKKSIDDSQKDYYLREQLKFIKEELGEESEEKRVIQKYEDRIKASKLPKEVEEKVNTELSRLKNMNISSAEGNTVQSYLDWVLDIPWGKYTREKLNIDNAEKILDEEHYGLKDVKERIIEYLAVKKQSGTIKGPILCLVGPPGVGKTSIAKSIAKAINRKYVRMSLGGLKDESEIRGHRRTYVAAMPGRIIYSLKEAKSMNPLILLDEIDKLSSDYKGNPADALLEVLDSEQNKTFRDNFIELPVDLSKVLFITTANSLDTIPRPLLDRMEVVEVSGYTYEEKFFIAKNHLIPKIFKEYNIKADKIEILDEAIKLVIDGYTRESGVRGLERKLGKLIRKAISKMSRENLKNIVIDENSVEEFMGSKVFEFDKVDNEGKVGVVTGMAWTAYGGDTLQIEAVVMNGTGKLQLTGKLGEVMQESAKAAYTYVRANAEKYSIKDEFYKNKDIHIHVPEGAVPKDGPSAGVTMVTALVSALTKKKVRADVAMTGEVTLTGRVLPIGGLKEKSLAAYRAGIKTIIIPKENEKDIKDIPESIRNNINIITAKEVQTVLENSIIGDDTNDN